MKITVCTFILSLLFVFFLFGNNVMAIESLTFGVRYWYPEWELDGYSDFNTLEWDTKYGMIGPSASLVITDKFALSASLYTGDFEKEFDAVNYGGYQTEAKWDSNRNDIDLIGVYIINKYLNVYGGLKYLTYDQKITGTWYGQASWQLDYDLEAYGPGIGSAFNLGLTPYISLYTTLSYSYLFGDFKITNPYQTIDEGDVTYPIIGIEFGSRYMVSAVPLVFMLSIRYQQSTISIDWENAQEDSPLYWDELDEKFFGLIFFAGYRFDFD